MKIKSGWSGISYEYPDDRVVTPEEFFNIMKKIHDNDKGYEENWHADMDNLMCRVLTDLGYGDGVDVFYDTDKWYS